MKQLEQILQKKGVAPTAMRLLILNEFVKCKEAKSLLDLEVILDRADRTTIYRTLKTFVDKGVLHPIELASESIKYALCADDCTQSYHSHIHPHFFCTKCKETICLEATYFRLEGVPEHYNICDTELLIKGICPKCRS